MYQNEWNQKPAGYYADTKTKTTHDTRQAEERRFSTLVEAELRNMGLSTADIPTADEIETAEEIARGKF